MGMVELHVKLYDELIQDGWFDFVGVGLLPQESDVRITSDNGSYNTLGYTDHVLFLAIHMVKHFIGIGMNIRMMLDVALYLSKYKHLIDSERFWSVLKQIHFDCVVNCVLTIMIRTGLLVWDDFPGACEVDSEKADLLLWDMVGAVFEPRRTQSENAYYEYSKHIMQKKMGQGKYRLYMLKWAVRNTLSQMWPDTDQLYALYQVNKDKRWMLPVLRIRRLFDLPIQKIKAGITPQRLLTDDSKEQESVGKRLKLFKQLDMLG